MSFLQLRRLLLLRSLSTSPSPTLNQTLIPLLSTNPTHHTPNPITSNFLSLPPFSLASKPFSSSSSSPTLHESQLAQSISSHLLQQPQPECSFVTQILQSSFPDITLTPSLILSVLKLSAEAGRTVLGFNHWLIQNPNFDHTDETLSYFVDYFGRRKDFKAAHGVILSSRRDVAGPKTLASAMDRLVRAGRPAQAVSMFDKMEEDYGIKRDKAALKLVVEKLPEFGFASNAEKMVKGLVNELFPDEYMCDLLIKGWCVDGKLDEARRLAGETYREALRLGPVLSMQNSTYSKFKQHKKIQNSSKKNKILL